MRKGSPPREKVRSGIGWMLATCLSGAGAVVWLLGEQKDGAQSVPIPAARAPGDASGARADPALLLADPRADPAAVQGRLVGPRGLPLADAQLVVGVLADRGGGWSSPAVLAEVRVADDGRFVARVGKPGPVWIHASLRHDGRHYQTCFAGPRSLLPRLLVLRPPDPERGVRRLRVTARRSDGTVPAVGTASVSEQVARGSRKTQFRRLEGDDSVFFEVLPASLAVWVRVVPPSGGTEPQLPLTLGPLPATSGHLHLRLPRVAKLSGRVEDGDGNPVAEEYVTVRPAAPDFPTDVHGTDWPINRTDAEGRFYLGPLPPGAYDLVLDALEDAPNPRVQTDRGDLVLRLSLPAPVVLRVLDAVGEPLPGAGVRAHPMERMRAAPGTPLGWLDGTRAGTSDATGAAKLRGLDPQAAYRLVVWPPRGRNELRPTHQDDWRPGSSSVTLVRKELVRVTVQDEAGLALPHASVWYQREKPPTDAGGFEPLSRSHGGGWHVDLPEGSVLQLFATHGERPRENATPDLRVTRPGDYTITLSRGPTLRLRFVGSSKPTSGVHVRVVEERAEPAPDDGSPRRYEVLDDAGRCEVFGLPADRTYSVLVGNMKGYGWGLVTGLRPGGEEVAVRASPGGPLQGTVLRARGVVEPDAFLVIDLFGRPLGARTDARGRFRFAEIPPGRWRLVAEVWRSGRVVRRASLEVEAHRDVTLTLRDVGD